MKVGPIAAGVQVEYPSVCPFSAENRWLLLQHADGRFGLHTGDGVFLQLLPPEISHHSEPRWSRTDPNRLYFVYGNALMGCGIGNTPADPEDIYATVLYVEHEFSEYIQFDSEGRDGVSGLGKADISLDGDHFVLRGIRPDDTQEVFVYQLSTGYKSLTFTPAAAFKNLQITSLNEILIGGDDIGVEIHRANGVTKLDIGNPHAAVTRDYLLYCSSRDNEINKNAVVAYHLMTGAKVVLFECSWDYGMHITSCDQDFCRVSLFTVNGSLPGQIWNVQLSESEDTLLYEWQTGPTTYENQPHAALSWDGSRCVVNENGGVSLLRLDGAVPAPSPIVTPTPAETRIDYSRFIGKEFVMRPRADGAVDIFERNVKA